jgi:hypothetical protein
MQVRYQLRHRPISFPGFPRGTSEAYTMADPGSEIAAAPRARRCQASAVVSAEAFAATTSSVMVGQSDQRRSSE